MELGLPNPATYNYGDEVKRIFDEMVALNGPPATPADYLRLQEVARAKAIAPKDSYGRTINQPGYGSSVAPDWGKDPSNRPGTQAEAAEAIAEIITKVGPVTYTPAIVQRPTAYPPPEDQGSVAIPTGGNMAGASSIGPQASQGFIEAITGGLSGFATGGILGGLGGAVTGLFGGGGGSTTVYRPDPCPEGFSWNGETCVRSGAIGTIQQILPGGQTGTGVDVYGQATVGSFGIPALVPATGSVPTRRCPPGAFLGKDNLCYQRGSIPNSFRKWPKPPKPILSAQDAKTLRKIGSIQNRVKRAWTTAGKPGQTKTRRK